MQVILVNNQYASGGRRLLAFIIDRFVIGFVVSILLRPFWHFPFEWLDDFWVGGFELTAGVISYKVLKEVVFLSYYSFMESSKYQGTLGKIMLGIRVSDLNGNAVALPKALLRNLGKYISGLILGIGFLMIIFDDRKQALHDKIADTLVVKV
jgi:uncharacterized RDD family membrane protein YckC